MNRAKIGLVLKRTFYFSILCTILFLGKCASEISEIRKIKKNNDIYYVVFGLKVGNNIPPIVMYEPTTQQPQPYEELPKTFDELAETVAVNINRYWDKKTNILENITLLEKGILIGINAYGYYEQAGSAFGCVPYFLRLSTKIFFKDMSTKKIVGSKDGMDLATVNSAPKTSVDVCRLHSQGKHKEALKALIELIPPESVLDLLKLHTGHKIKELTEKINKE